MAVARVVCLTVASPTCRSYRIKLAGSLVALARAGVCFFLQSLADRDSQANFVKLLDVLLSLALHGQGTLELLMVGGFSTKGKAQLSNKADF